MTEQEFEKYTGNLRIVKISFDALSQMWPKDEYDQKTEAPNAKFYIGKVGKFSSGSYIHNHVQRCASIVINFENGQDVLVTPDDVAFTNEPITPKCFLPVIEKKRGSNFVALTESEKEFADKVFLQLIGSGSDMNPEEICALYDSAISAAMYRTVQHGLFWDKTWIDKLDS